MKKVLSIVNSMNYLNATMLLQLCVKVRMFFVKILTQYLAATSFTAITTSMDDCMDGESRLVNGTSDLMTGNVDGRIEICINKAWGSVCTDSFGASEAFVVCKHFNLTQTGTHHFILQYHSDNSNGLSNLTRFYHFIHRCVACF